MEVIRYSVGSFELEEMKNMEAVKPKPIVAKRCKRCNAVFKTASYFYCYVCSRIVANDGDINDIRKSANV